MNCHIGSSIAKAIAAFQTGLKPVPRNAIGEDGRRYADLPSLRKRYANRLAANGLSLIQCGDESHLTTLLLHTSGEYIELVTQPRVAADGIQHYGPRYAFMLALGIVEQPEQAPTARERWARSWRRSIR